MWRAREGVLDWVSMTRYLVLSVVLLACSGPQRAESTEYRRGTYAPVRPAPARPGVGAPVVGQPGYVGPIEGIPRSPYGRVLPQTPETRREPGIWAADNPPSVKWTFMGTPLPLPPPENSTQFDESLALACAQTAGKALAAVTPPDLMSRAQYLSKIPTKEYACVSANAYQVCVKLALAEHRRTNSGSANDIFVGRRLEKFQETAQKFVSESCPAILAPQTNKLIGDILGWYNAQNSQRFH